MTRGPRAMKWQYNLLAWIVTKHKDTFIIFYRQTHIIFYGVPDILQGYAYNNNIKIQNFFFDRSRRN